MTLPALRDELSLHPGPLAADGSPTWILRDPVRNRFFRIGWAAFEILAHWQPCPPETVAAAVNTAAPLAITADDVTDTARFLTANQLVRVDVAADSTRLARIAQAERSSWLSWLIHHYLFFRLPLVRPDRFLQATAGLVSWAYRPGFWGLTLAVLVLGLFLVHRQWDRFTATLLDTFTWDGMAGLGAALVLAKIVHEFAHAWTARRLGCRVPTMGLAFLVMWPVLYTDTNEAWLLSRRRDRLAVAAAGVLAELALAAWATLAWGFLPEGGARQAAFALASTTWISSLAINLSPFMRFDGYFLLMDALDLPNLHDRAFALARWHLRERLFGLNEPPPEPFPPARTRLLVLFAWMVWLYRLVLFLGIAVLVYHFFIKLLGIVMFVIEIGWFVALPVGREIREWWRRRRVLAASRRSWRTALLLGLLLTALAVPWQSRVSAPALLQAAEHVALYPPVAGQLRAMLVSEGQEVAAGDLLFVLASPDLAHRQHQVGQRIAVLEYELAAVGFDPAFRQRSQVLRQDMETATAERLGLDREQAQLRVEAPMAGRVVDLAPDLSPGQWLAPKERLAAIAASQGPATLVAYLGEEDVERVAAGAVARLFPDAPGRAPVDATVRVVERTPVRLLAEPALATVFGGGVAVRATDKGLVPEAVVYRMRLVADIPSPATELRGTVQVAASAESPLLRLWRAAVGTLLRESGM